MSSFLVAAINFGISAGMTYMFISSPGPASGAAAVWSFGMGIVCALMSTSNWE